MSSKLNPFKNIKKFKVPLHLYFLLLFLMFSNRERYLDHALLHRDWGMLLKILLSMCSPLAIAIMQPTKSQWRKAMRYAKRKRSYPY